MSGYRKTPTPEEQIDEAINREDWFSAFSNSVTYFEFWAYVWLWRYCNRENIHVGKIIKSLNARQYNLTLLLLKLTDSNVFNKMTKVIKERNNFVHPEQAEEMLASRHKNKEERDEAIRILRDAKYCVRKVREGAIAFK